MTGELKPSTARWLGAASILTVLVVWELACRFGAFTPVVLPAPSSVLERLWVFMTDAQLRGQLALTLQRLAAGLALGITGGVALGIAAASFRPTARMLEVFIGVLAPLPKIALYPALLLTLGFASAPKIALVAIESLFPILIATSEAVALVDRRMLWSAASMGTSRGRALHRVVLPACLPAIITGVRIGAVIACIVVLLAEMVASTNGLGYVLVIASRNFHTADMFVPIVIMSVIGFALDKLLGWLAQRTNHA